MDNNVIQVTSDYNQFKFLVANRDENRQHVEALKVAFAEIGNLTRVQPILVNEEYEIIDGQHRFIAAKDMGEPIYFVQVPGLGITEARSMNILHRNWSPLDFAKSYAASGNRSYQLYLQLQDEYEFPHSLMLYALYGTDKKGSFKGFREGHMEITDNNEERFRQHLAMLGEVEDALPVRLRGTLGYALVKAFNNEQYNQGRFMTALRKYLTSHQFLVYRTVEENLRELEEIYNFDLGPRNRVRLY